MHQTIYVRRFSLLFLLGAISFIQAGCVSLSTFRSPKAFEPGEFAAGVGLSGIATAEGSVFGIPEVIGRVGVARNLDMGFQVGLGGVLAADLNYQLVDAPFYVSTSLGASYAGVIGSDVSVIGLYPMILAGSERLYGGVKLAYLTASLDFFEEDNDSISGRGFLPGIVLGASIGDRFKLMPEVNLYYSPEAGTAFAFGGVGFRYAFVQRGQQR